MEEDQEIAASQPDRRSSVAFELENYLDCRDVADDPLEFWRNHKQTFPRLFEIVKQTPFAPFARRSTAGIERIFNVAGYILNERRTRTSDENFENQLFANVNLELSECTV